MLSTTNTLTPEIQKALDLLEVHGELIRYPGGYWSYRGARQVRDPTALEEKRPEVWTTVNVLNALVNRDLVVIEGEVAKLKS